jgi:acyl-CoA synthetase (AMP-forming)/AMP-acid ligase II
MDSKTRVHLMDIANGLLKGLPRAHIALAGLCRLALIRPGQRNSIGLVLERQAARRPAQTALVDAGAAYSYGQLNRQANRLAHLLKRIGLQRGDRVAVLMENRIDLPAVAAGTVKRGCVGVMLNHHQRGDVLAHSLSITAPKAMIVGTECREAFESVRDRLPAALSDSVFWLADGDHDTPPADDRDLASEMALESDENPSETATVTTREPAFHVLTSGTTGMPKAAIMSHGRWLRAMYGVGLASLGMRDDDIFYCPLPLYHNNALTLSCGAVLGSGATLPLAPPLPPPVTTPSRPLSQHGCNWLTVMPASMPWSRSASLPFSK